MLQDEGGLTPQQYVDLCTAMNQPISKSRYYTIKGAYQYGLAERISAQLREGKALRKSGEDIASVEAFAGAISAAEYLAAQKPDYDKSRYRDNSPPAHTMPFHQEHGADGSVSLKKKKGKNSKRQHLGRLNKAHPDWQEKLFEAMPEQHRTAFAIMATTGCRPVELEHGITLSDRDGQLEIKILGAKTGQGHGQKERVLTFKPNNVFERTVYEAIQDRQDLTWKPKTTYRAFHKSYAKAVTALGSRWKGKIAPYSHRHQFAADLKAAGLEPKAIEIGRASCRERVLRLV